ncbi:MAG: hypothetical protein ACKVWV_18140 [Planctomycetota bacterium]
MLLLLSASATAQRDLSHRLRAKGAVKNGGIYHVGTGTWTRAGALGAELGPTFRTIYNNTCSTTFFGLMYPGDIVTDEGRLPGAASPDKLYDQDQGDVATYVGPLPNACPEGPASAVGSARGTAAVGGSYTIDAIAIGYCSDVPGPFSVPAGTGASITLEFRESTVLTPARCALSPLLAPAPQASLALVGMPGAHFGPFACWVVVVDLVGGSGSFSMKADGDGNYDSAPQATSSELDHCFSWSFTFPGIASPTTSAASGLFIAGCPADAAHGGWATATTTGGGSLPACSEYDGTVWDHQEANAAPVYAVNGVVTNANSAEGPLTAVASGGEPGTGMTTQDSLRVDINPATSYNGCHFFGGPGGLNPFASFHLELFTLAASNVTPVSPGSGFCFGDNCAFTCPCVAPNTVPSPAGGHESGCANSNPLAIAGLLGARLDCTGSSVVSASPVTDTVEFQAVTGTAGFGFLVKGNAKTPNGVFPATADGIRCASGALVRFGGHNAGSNGDAPGHWSYPNTAQTTTVSGASAQSAGQNAQYQLFYRNPAAGFCSTFTTNFSNGQILVW